MLLAAAILLFAIGFMSGAFAVGWGVREKIRLYDLTEEYGKITWRYRG